MSIVALAIWIIIVAAVAAIVFVACKAMGVTIPNWVVLWIVVVAVVCIAAIKFLVGAL